MKKIVLWLLVLAAAIALGYWLFRPRPAPLAGARAVEIRDRVTIDFSRGTPVVRDDAGEQAIIDAAVKEMNEAAKNIRFEPLPPPNIEIPPPPQK